MGNVSALFFVSKRNLLFIASFVWFLAGGILIFRGASGILNEADPSVFKSAIAVLLGLLFYAGVFRRISMKHITRIKQMQNDNVPFYSFFPGRSFLIMILMMSMGIALKISGVFPTSLMVYFFPVMGLPLFISAFRFFRHGYTYK